MASHIVTAILCSGRAGQSRLTAMPCYQVSALNLEHCRQVDNKRLNCLGVSVQPMPLLGTWKQCTVLRLSAVQEGSQGAAEHAGSEHPDQGFDQGGEAGRAEGALWQGVWLHQGAGYRGAQGVCLHGARMCRLQLSFTKEQAGFTKGQANEAGFTKEQAIE